jgi:hypothetical protein
MPGPMSAGPIDVPAAIGGRSCRGLRHGAVNPGAHVHGTSATRPDPARDSRPGAASQQRPDRRMARNRQHDGGQSAAGAA